MDDSGKLVLFGVIALIMLFTCPSRRKHQEAIVDYAVENAGAQMSGEDRFGVMMAMALVDSLGGQGSAKALMAQAVEFKSFTDLKILTIGRADGFFSIGAFGKVLVFSSPRK